MMKTELKTLINACSKENPLKVNEEGSYVEEFIKEVANVSKDNRILDKKIKEDLLGEPYSCFKYNQSVAEMMVWFFCEQTGLDYGVEKKLNPPKDVDFQIIQNGVNYNIEVKSPEYEISDNRVLTGRIASRTDRVNLKDTLYDLNNLFRKNLENTEFKDVNMVLPKDNKIKDCLISCQGKFLGSDAKNFNVLLLSTTSDEMPHYLEYFMNTESGFFTNYSYVQPKEFDKVGAVVITNAISINQKYDDCSWDIQKAKTIVLDNPFCSHIDHGQIEKFRGLFPNCTVEFWLGLQEFRKKNPGFPDIIYYYDYIKGS